MALTGRRLCRLDAICAKLKQINHDTSTDAKDGGIAANGGIVAGQNGHQGKGIVGEKAEDLTMKCLNNNVIGTVDLHHVEAEDLTVHKTEKKTESVVSDGNGSNDQSQHGGNKTHDSVTNRSDGDKRKHRTEDGPKISNTPSGSSRRKSRKAAAPRNINQVREFYNQFDVDDKDELAEYEANNQNTNFPPDNCDNEDRETDRDSFGGGDSTHGQASPGSHDSLGCSKDYEDNLSTSSRSSHSKSQKELSGHNDTVDLSNHSRDSAKRSLGYSSFDTQSHEALDLSVHKDMEHRGADSPMNGYLSSDDEDFFHPDKHFEKDKEEYKTDNLSSSTSSNESRRDSSEQSTHLKDYAESTMNELISMYGFGGAGLSNIAKTMPMTNFSSSLQARFPGVAAKMAACMALQPGVQTKLMNGVVPKVEPTEAGQPMKGIYANFVQKVQAASTPVKASEAATIKPINDRFTNSAAYINAVFNSQHAPHGDIATGATTGKLLVPDYSKYLKRFNNGSECGGYHCFDLGYKEHYHCIDCSFQVFIKKEEMVRHYKWHRKREESLQHGFLRFSPLDNCTKKFGMCTHNGRQTHYHCLQNGCDKVYISTSDVQMHANYHRKDSAIMSEGFQRFRATEDCGTQACAFYGHRTTHFHCLRPGCRFTFKNKADMEKHKSYHQKDEVLGRDGFKKFMKYEQCAYSTCRYSKVSNHIHCIRKGCDYVLHSTAQLYSHKRKHERRDFEHAYKQYQDGHQAPGLQSHGPPILPSVNGNAVMQHLPMLSPSVKRSAEEIGQPEVKRIKVETSDVDESAPSSPSGGISEGRSTPLDRSTPQSDQGDYEENMEVSNHEENEDSADVHNEMSNMSGVNLNNSLNLPIPGNTSINEERPSLAADNQSLWPAVAGNQSVENTKPGTLPINFPTGSLTVGSLPMLNPTLMTVPSQTIAASTALQPPKSVYTERREKDDSWKIYLVRYTANDPCNPRCQYLYKDHYHCKVDGCLVLFKSKDGVREHARFHELQDRITPIAYRSYEQMSTCPEACQYSGKEKHYHCIWSGCTHVVPHFGPTFGRLEHYRVHEMARTAAGKSYSRPSTKPPTMSMMDDTSIRRRGRPPKYPKLDMPQIPKVVLSDEEIRKSAHVNLVQDGDLPQTKVINGFRMFTRDDPCPDQECPYVGRHHFHCARPRCFTVTDRMDILNLHAKDFHNFVTIMDGFEYFDRSASCRRMHCQHNQTNRHFHCTRKRCDYSFIRHSTMAQHDKKHNTVPVPALSGPISRTDLPISPSTFIPIVPAMPSNTVKSPTITPVVQPAGSFIPTSILQQFQNITNIPFASVMAQSANQIAAMTQAQIMMPQVSMPGIPISTVTVGAVPMTISSVQALPATISTTQLTPSTTTPNAVSNSANMTSPLITAASASMAASAINSPPSQGPTMPLTLLLQRGANQIPQPSWADMRSRMHFAITQNCGRPFCKLKKKDHYHCSECNQAFSDPARLRSHIGKHGLKFKRPELGGSMVQPVDIAPRPSVMIDDPAIDDLDPDEAQCLAEGGEMPENGDSDDNDELKGSSSLTLNPSTFSQMISKAQEENRIASDIGDSDDGLASVSHASSKSGANDGASGGNLVIDESVYNEDTSDILNYPDRMIAKSRDNFMNSSDIINLNKSHQISSPRSMPVNTTVSKTPNTSIVRCKDTIVSSRMKDDSVPAGYTRWKYNDECNYMKCAYRHSVTHFHCVRPDCGYGFSDRSRLVQHTLRHERIDSITGGEMQQYRINQDCKMGGCEYNTRMSHFHCHRCNYSCTDSSKVLTHRKHHAKLDNINSQGFQKYQAIEDCAMPLCPYARKQNHYHCLVPSCMAAVLGPAQMSAHKVKHETE